MVYLCGTPRDAEEDLVAMTAPHAGTPCAVCFARASALCNSCGKTIKNIRPADMMLTPVMVRPNDWMTNGLGVGTLAHPETLRERIARRWKEIWNA